jgi:DNA-binding response OmpR family regulator
MKILVVEDDKSIRDIVCLVAETAFPQASIESACCGHEALASAGRTGAPDLVLLDLGLPDMSGFDVFMALKRMGFSSKVIVVTAEDAPLQRTRAARLGAAAFVSKPFSSRLLRETMRELFRTPGEQYAHVSLLA